MDYRKIGDNFVLRIDKGEEVINKLTELCKLENIRLGSVVGLGATDNVTIGLFDTTLKKYHSKTLTGPMEITSLVGNISEKNGDVYLHIHINVSDGELNTKGGHLNECYISATCEIIITAIDGNVDRELNEEIGLNLIKF